MEDLICIELKISVVMVMMMQVDTSSLGEFGRLPNADAEFHFQTLQAPPGQGQGTPLGNCATLPNLLAFLSPGTAAKT